jgi:tryptophan synthase alpha chain
MSRGEAGAHRIERAIRATTVAGRPALGAFLTAGFPSREEFPHVLERVAAATELVEVGVPWSDPMADGVTIQKSSRLALAAGVGLSWILDTLEETPVEVPVLLMSYVNPLIAFGADALVRRARAAGVAGFVVQDLPYEECGPLRERADREGLALVQLVSPVTEGERLRRLCEASRGFVYAVTVTGTTGGSAGRAERMLAHLDRVRAASSLPVLAGFGIRSADQLQAIHAHADGAIVGSALIETIDRGEDPAAFLRGLRPGRGR